jgi:hypothetical protein
MGLFMWNLSVLLWPVVLRLARRDNRVILRNEDGTLGDHSKLATGKLIKEMAKGVVVLFFFSDLLDGQLQFALYFSHK